jgi:hypothetical protein
MMELNVFKVNGHSIAEIFSEDVVINSVQDALDIMANASEQAVNRIIVHEKQLTPAFFDLRTRLAGEILQKHANYRVKVAIVGEFDKFESKSLQAFIVESNRGELVFFVPNREAAIARLAR